MLPDLPLTVLDLAPVHRNSSVRDSFAASVELARTAERTGYRRVWYAEHHNMPTIASSATAVLIAHIAAHTASIRLGAGGIMLPNHAPLTIAEQFGTLATLHPDRIDLAVGRAPGGDQSTFRALRRTPQSSDAFPQDVAELQAYLAGDSIVPGVSAIPGEGTRVPLIILGSSLFGAQLAAARGLPFGFASHFAPQHLREAVSLYRDRYRPSEENPRPYVFAGINLLAAPTREEAEDQRTHALRARVRALARRQPGTPDYGDDEIDAFLETPGGRSIATMLHHSAVGTGDDVTTQLHAFASDVEADELVVVPAATRPEQRLAALEITAAARAVITPARAPDMAVSAEH